MVPVDDFELEEAVRGHLQTIPVFIVAAVSDRGCQDCVLRDRVSHTDAVVGFALVCCVVDFSQERFQAVGRMVLGTVVVDLEIIDLATGDRYRIALITALRPSPPCVGDIL